MPVTHPRVPRPPRRLGLVVAATALWIGAAPVSAAGEVIVDVRTMSYAPSAITVARGTTVTWSNTVSPNRVHDVVSSIEGLFDSGRFGRGQSWSYRFDAAGTFNYLCSIHDEMLGVVRVPLTGRVVETPSGPAMRLRLAAQDLPASSPFRYVVLRRGPGEAHWTRFRRTTSAVLDYRPEALGTYEFVMRIRNTASERPTGPAGDSPALRLVWAG